MKSKKIRPGTLVLFFYKKITRFEPYEIIYSSDATLVWIVVVWDSWGFPSSNDPVHSEMIAGILGFQVTKPDYHPFDTFELFEAAIFRIQTKIKK